MTNSSKDGRGHFDPPGFHQAGASHGQSGSLTSQIGRKLRLRRRHLLTRDGRLRLRFAVPPAMAAVCALSLSFGLPVAGGGIDAARPAQIASVDQASEIYGFYKKRMERYGLQGGTQDSAAPEPEPETADADDSASRDTNAPSREKVLEIGKGDTLSELLQRAGIAAEEAYQMVEALEGAFDPRNLKPGQKLAFHFKRQDDTGAYNMARVDMPIDSLKSVALEKTGDGNYRTSVIEKPTSVKLYAHRAKIENSLYGSAAKAGIPASVVADMIKIYSYNVDFQRDVRKGDVAEALYEQVETEDGNPVRTGNLLYARLIIDGRSVPVYRYERDGVADYYSADGKSVRKALMRTPVDGARISSGFGLRMHPVLGYTKMHKGIDFAAPVGTPVYAAGSGVVEKAGPFSSYGNYIRLRHANGMRTAYAHLSRFAPSLRPGMKVTQGQIIGYVGRTGRVTGAHLHYEVLVNNKQVNPGSVIMAQADALRGKDLSVFRAYVAKLDQQYRALSGSLKYAARRDQDSASAVSFQ